MSTKAYTVIVINEEGVAAVGHVHLGGHHGPTLRRLASSSVRKLAATCRWLSDQIEDPGATLLGTAILVALADYPSELQATLTGTVVGRPGAWFERD